MGDADLRHQVMNREGEDEDIGIEDRLDEFQENVEEELDLVYNAVELLEKRMKSLVKCVKSQKIMWEAFVAFNFLVIPIGLALIFAFFTQDLNLIDELLLFRKITVMGLVLCSAVVGIPFYLRSLWQLHTIQNEETYNCGKRFNFDLLDDDGAEGDVETDGSPHSDETQHSSSSSENRLPLLREVQPQLINNALVLQELNEQEIEA